MIELKILNNNTGLGLGLGHGVVHSVYLVPAKDGLSSALFRFHLTLIIRDDNLGV